MHSAKGETLSRQTGTWKRGKLPPRHRRQWRQEVRDELGGPAALANFWTAAKRMLGLYRLEGRSVDRCKQHCQHTGR